MRRLHWITLRSWPGPFLGWLGTLMFLFLMQFLMKYLPDIVGKGLPFGVIVELISYNLAYMVVLAVPMAALLATLMTYGRLSESNAYLAIKSAGISLGQLIWPTAVLGILLTAGMAYFNNHLLPEANFRAKMLWQDIHEKEPGFQLQPGVFYEGIDDYSILVRARDPETDSLYDITIYSYAERGRGQTTIKAERGHLTTQAGGTALELVLNAGQIHRLMPAAYSYSTGAEARYEQISFERHRLVLELSDVLFERSDPRESSRSDRTTPTVVMLQIVDSLQAHVDSARVGLRSLSGALWEDAHLGEEASAASGATSEEQVAHVSGTAAAAEQVAQVADAAAIATARTGAADSIATARRNETYETALERARRMRAEISDYKQTLTWEAQRADQYRVEIHKKFSIAFACLLFMIIGAPLGLSIRRGGLGAIAALAMGIFLFYWITLVQGEKLADRDLLEPWVGMWIANLVMALVGIGLYLYVAKDLRATPTPWRRLFD